ncbi:hypothetical protein JJJ17_11395 [Paracoccus caeni]|uniref:Peptidase inhibitor I78 family protein n=1 Tax=Paracoccus caeni TaxID=657651 RepID=A0A934SCU8_9RHOB|nr:I78 family peptidase inhibitor [Paracoccus caeni]MBK4216531.1 hypothetical protein [Paracoccus caeni]
MRLLPLLIAPVAALTLAACEPVPADDVTTEPSNDECKASSYQGLVGQPRDVLAQMNFPIGTRQIGPNDAVTADFRPDRLNIEYGESGRIEKVSCY